jgi:hypothetical protein
MDIQPRRQRLSVSSLSARVYAASKWTDKVLPRKELIDLASLLRCRGPRYCAQHSGRGLQSRIADIGSIARCGRVIGTAWTAPAFRLCVRSVSSYSKAPHAALVPDTFSDTAR